MWYNPGKFEYCDRKISKGVENSIAGSSNGRTSPFEGEYRGSNPRPAGLQTKMRPKGAILHRDFL